MNHTQAAKLLEQRDNILILTHRLPDGDTIGSAVGLCSVLRQRGKTAWLMPNADASALFVPYMEGLLAPDGFTPQFVVAVDIADEGLFTREAQPYLGKVDLSIDHHGSHTGFGRENCVDARRSSCGELIYDIVRQLGEVTQEIALPLYVAVSTDTGCFVYNNTRPETHRVAADLMEIGGQACLLANKRHFRTKSLRRLRLESMMVERMACYDEGRTAVTAVTLEMLAAIGATKEDLEDISAFIGQAEGVELAVTLREIKPGCCKISVRATAGLNASEICAHLGGGGHPGAAGCTVLGTMEEAAQRILEAIAEVRAHA